MPTRIRAQRSFTLMELLVVISIIILATAMAVPAVSKFTKGQALENAGRLMQSTFNEGRRAAITSRRQHYLIFFTRELQNPVREVFGVRVFQKGRVKGDGYTTNEYLLPNTIILEHEKKTGTAGLFGVAKDESSNKGCNVAIFQECPYPGPGISGDTDDERPNWISATAYTTFFEYPAMRWKRNDNYGFIEFNRDGSINLDDDDVPAQRIGGDSLYDRNVAFDESQLVESNIKADLTFRQIGSNKKRSYVDIDPNTGRVRYRVVNLQGYSGGGSSSTTGE